MSKTQTGELLVSMLLGTATAATIGTLLFQAVGVILLGLLGALGGWLFENLIRPKLNKFLTKKKEKA